MGHRSGLSRDQTALFPVMLDEVVGEAAVVRVIDAWVGKLDMVKLGFHKAQALARGAPPYHPADLLKLYLWGYIDGCRSSRSLERECHRNVECMWLLGRLAPDHKTIANFRKDNSAALVATCAKFVEFAVNKELVKSKTVAIDGSKVRAVASRKAILSTATLAKQAQRNKEAIEAYMKLLDEQDLQEDGCDVRRRDVQRALEELKAKDGLIEQQIRELTEERKKMLVKTEPEAQVMKSLHSAPGYNLQAAVEAESHLIVHHEVCTDANDLRQLQPMAESAAAILRSAPRSEDDSKGGEVIVVAADSGFANGQQIDALGKQQIVTFVAPNRGFNHHGLFDKDAFSFDPEGDHYTCPASKILRREKVSKRDNSVFYAAKARDCGACELKSQCTKARKRTVTRHPYEEALQANSKRVQDNPEMLRLRKQTVEHPFGTLKDVIMRNARLLMRGLEGARGELGLGILAYNIKRVFNMKGSAWMHQALQG